MKKLVITVFLSSICCWLAAQDLRVSDVASSVDFSIKNFALTVKGSFKGLKGKIVFNPGQPGGGSMNVSVDATTVDTDNNTRDKHLQQEDYLHVAKFPLITFVSSDVRKNDKSGWIVYGKITIKGITKNISFPFEATKSDNGHLFTGTFELNRRDFGVGGNSFVLSDKLTVSLRVLAKNNN